MTMHISADVQITLNASCMTILGERTEQLDIFCCVTGFTSDFLSFIDVELIRFFHGAIHSDVFHSRDNGKPSANGWQLSHLNSKKRLLTTKKCEV